MSIFKRHSYDIFKLYLNQIGITVFSLILITAFGWISDSMLLPIAISTFTTLFFSVLIYTTAWNLGAKDRLNVDSGRAEECPAKGVVLSLFANVPNFLLAGFAALFLAIGRSGAGAFYSIGAVLLTVAKFTMAIYLGLVESALAFADDWGSAGEIVTALGYFVVPVISIFVTELGYYFGLREKKLFGGSVSGNQKTK